MKIVIKETQKTESISIICPKTWVDYTVDFIKSAGYIDKFEYDKADDAYICTQEIFEKWSKIVKENQKLLFRLSGLKNKHGATAVNNALCCIRLVECNNFEDHAANVNKVLDKVFGPKE